MPELNDNPPATVPDQPEAKAPVRKTMPVVIALVVIMGLIGIANLSSLLRGGKRAAPAGSLPITRPAAPNAQQVTSFETQQQLQAERDAQERQHQQEVAAAMQQLEATQGVPGPEDANAPPMTAAQRAAIYGESPNAPVITSDASQARAEAKQRELAKEKLQLDAINSDTVAIDFEQPSRTIGKRAIPSQGNGVAGWPRSLGSQELSDWRSLPVSPRASTRRPASSWYAIAPSMSTKQKMAQPFLRSNIGPVGMPHSAPRNLSRSPRWSAAMTMCGKPTAKR